MVIVMPYKDPQKRKEYQDNWWRQHGVEYRARRRWAYQNNRPVMLAKRAEYRHSVAQPRKYHISVEQKQAIWSQQRQQCAICQCRIELHGSGTHIDHDHTSGLVRGLLCRNCNTAIGLLCDSPETLHRAYEYLKDAKERESASAAAENAA